MKRFERLGIPADRIELEEMIDLFNMNKKYIPPIDRAGRRLWVISHSCSLLSVYSFLVDDLIMATEWAERSVQYADQYFWGDWRDLAPTGEFNDEPPNREYQNIHRAWDLIFQSSLLCASNTCKWNWLAKLGLFFRDDIQLNIDQTNSNRAWYLLVAGVLRGRSWSQMDSFFQTTQNSPQKREKLLARLLHSIVEGTESDRVAATKEYFTHFKRSERKSQYINIMLPWDASFLVHYAKHVGKPLPVPLDMTDYIIDLGAE
jgi:hypothetical protein